MFYISDIIALIKVRSIEKRSGFSGLLEKQGQFHWESVRKRPVNYSVKPKTITYHYIRKAYKSTYGPQKISGAIMLQWGEGFSGAFCRNNKSLL